MSLFSSFFSQNTSDQSRSSFCGNSKCWGPLVGLAVGLIYAGLEYWFDAVGTSDHPLLWFMHKGFDLIVPIVLGVLAGIGMTLFQRNQSLNQSLSTQNYNLRSRLLANTLLAHVLHEIRNPIHNLSALLEKSIHHLPQTDREIAERNLQRLSDTAEQLKRMSGPWDEISARQRTVFTDWLHSFLNQSVHNDLNAASIRYSENIKPFIAHVHPLLLEQCFTILFQNAIQACSKKHLNAAIQLNARMDSSKHGFAVIEIINNGANFPDHVLAAAAKKAVRSATGMGIGLMLARDTLENIGGTLEIANNGSRAAVKIEIPAESLL